MVSIVYASSVQMTKIFSGAGTQATDARDWKTVWIRSRVVVVCVPRATEDSAIGTDGTTVDKDKLDGSLRDRDNCDNVNTNRESLRLSIKFHLFI